MSVLNFCFDLILLVIKFWSVIIKSIVDLFIKKEENVAGKIVLVTGAGSGIGRELALQYSKLCANVVCLDVNEERNIETVKMINDGNQVFGKAFGYTVDVTNREKIFEIADKVLNEVGFVDILINNAGIAVFEKFLSHKESDIRNLFDINILSHCWILQAFLPIFLEEGRGHIVSISSMAGIIGSQNLSVYSATKFAVRGLNEALREELSETNIKFTTIHPFFAKTALLESAVIHNRFQNIIPVLEASDVAKATISAQRKHLEEISIPRFFFYLNTLFRFFPNRARLLLLHSLGIKAESC